MNKLIFLILITMTFDIKGQIKTSAYHAMLSTIYSNAVPLIKCEELKHLSHPILMDTREIEEYKVSHIKNAICVEYEKFDKSKVENISKDAEIIVYCSVGGRSEKIGEKLIALGFKNVKNLYGGIFEWVNEGNKVYKDDSMETNEIHPYSSAWGIWLDKGNKVYK